MRRALLLSGGIDSMALAYRERPEWAITLDYGQIPAPAETHAASVICSELGIQHVVLGIDCSSVGAGDLIGTEPLKLSPMTVWWPFRNQLLITLSASRMLKEGVSELLIGTVREDDRFNDGTAAFVDLMSRLLSIQEGGMSLSAPALQLTSVELVRSARIPKGMLAIAHSCHVSNLTCGQCPGCLRRLDTLEAIGYR